MKAYRARGPFLCIGGGILAAAFGLGIALLVKGSNADPKTYYKPEGYVQRVKDLIDRGLLVIDPQSHQVVLKNNQLSEGQLAWVNASLLPRDINDFNADITRGQQGQPIDPAQPPAVPDGFLRRADNSLTVVDHYHTFNFAARSPHYRWAGGMLFAPYGAKAGLEIKSGATTLRTLPADPAQPGAQDAELSCRSAPRQATLHQASKLRLSIAAATNPQRPRAALVYQVGDSLVMSPDVDDAVTVSLNGIQANRQMPVRLDRNDIILLSVHGGPGKPDCGIMLTVTGGTDAGIMNAAYRDNDGLERRASSGAPPGLDLMANALDQNIMAEQRLHAARNDDVYLTLDETLQSDVQRVLETYAKRWNADRQEIAAAITVMDATSGRVLALASHTRATASTSPRKERRLARNQNFVEHGIGSASKPLLAASILHARPDLLALRRAPYGTLGPGTTAGFALSSPVGAGDHSSGIIGFHEFLTHSSNPYMVDLAMFALLPRPVLDPPAPRGAVSSPTGYWLGDQPVRSIDKQSAHFVQSSGGRPSELMLYEPGRIPGFLQSFRDLFSVQILEAAQEQSAPLDLKYGDTGLLAPLIDRFEFRHENALARFDDAIPDNVNLRIESIRYLREQFVSFLLGDFTNRWTNVRLAEAYSRLATGTNVTAQLIHGFRRPDDEQPITLSATGTTPQPDIGPNDQGRAAILSAMENVAVVGTASPLRDTVQKIRLTKPDFALYAKTGTPRGTSGTGNSAILVFTAGGRASAHPRTGVAADHRIRDGVTVAISIEDRGASTIAVDLGKEVLNAIARHQGWTRAPAATSRTRQ